MSGESTPLRHVVQRGLWFEELKTGVLYETGPAAPTETDNVLFSTLTMNTQGSAHRRG